MADSENTKPFYGSPIPGDWKLIEFGQFVEKLKGKYTPHADEDLRCIELEHLEQWTGQISGWVNSSSQKSTKNTFSKGDVLYGKLRPYLRKFWHATFDGVCTSEIWVLNSKGNHCANEFLFRLVQSHRFNQIANVTSGSKMPRADWDYVSEYPFALPPKPEQRAIANVLGLVDRAIELNNKIIAQKELRKKWLMQNLLTGKKRLKGFTDEWKVEVVKKVVTPVKRPLVPEETEYYQQVGIRSHTRGIFHKEKVLGASLGDKSVFWVEPDCFILNIVFAWEHAVAKTTQVESGMIASHRFPMFRPKEQLDLDYFLYYFSSSRGKYLLGLASPGGAGRNKTLGKSDFLNLRIPVPSLNEQLAIIKVLRGADKELALLKGKTTSFKQLKKGLMQKLLTGKVRLNIGDSDK